MSNKHHQRPETTPTSPAAAPSAPVAEPSKETAETPTTTLTTTAEVTPSVELATTEVVAEVPDDGRTLVHLASRLPHLRKPLTSFKRVQPSEIEAAVRKLSSEKQEAFEAMVERMNPQKPGMHTNNTSARLSDIRLYQGTGDDEMRPKMTPPGGYYGTDSRILAVPSDYAIGHPGIPHKLVGAVLAMIDGRTFWAPRGEKGKAKLPPGVVLKGNEPICRSLDQKRGDRYGVCDECPHRPFKDSKFDRESCKNEVQLYVMLKGFTGLYRMVISGTSVKTGAGPVRAKTRNWSTLWDYYFAFDALEVKKDGNRWFQVEADVAREGNVDMKVDPADAAVFALMQRQIDQDFYYPELARTYAKSEKAPQNEESQDVNALAANAAASAAASKGYSDNNL